MGGFLFVLVTATGCLGPGTLKDTCNWEGERIVQSTCVSCHSSTLEGSARADAPEGVNFDTPGDVRRHAAAIRQTTLVDRTMPPSGPLRDCNLETLESYLDELESGACVPSCSGRVCGDDGCGGTCGDCPSGLVCNDAGACQPSLCTPDCTGKLCGEDGCGGTCGTCGDGLTCANGGAACACVPSCAGKACGPDGCGGSCGTCPGMLLCNTQQGSCSATCTPSCAGRICGDDGCGGSCGTCGSGTSCNSSGQCVCVPQCAGKQCGPNGCGGSCGTCTGGASCSAGSCVYPTKSYAADVAPAFMASCASNACHDAANPADGLDLSSAAAGYADLVNRASTQCTAKLLVAPGNLTGSYLWNKLGGTGMCSGSQMPKAGQSMTQAELDAVRAWIMSGAAP